METPTWEPGELNTRQVEQVAIAAIADIWSDTQSEVARLDSFCQRIESHIRTATGCAIRVTS
jgi:hypothetical protein